jgi:hypothetical protein
VTEEEHAQAMQAAADDHANEISDLESDHERKIADKDEKIAELEEQIRLRDDAFERAAKVIGEFY